VLAELLSRGILSGEDLEMIFVANMLARLDVNPDGHA
jgi:hypothetical protein